jgi:hypothetical protein
MGLGAWKKVRVLASIFALSVLTLGVSAWPACSSRATGVGASPIAHRAPLRVECGAPRRLHLRRLEDGSAWLLCRQRILVRVSVPR